MSQMAEEEEFVVNKIVNKRVTSKGKIEYLVQWKGFAESDNTWESKDALIEVSSAAIDVFESNFKTESNEMQSNDYNNEEIQPIVETNNTSKELNENKEEMPLRDITKEKCRQRGPKKSSHSSDSKKTAHKTKKSKASLEVVKQLEDKLNNELKAGIDYRQKKGFDRNLEADKICGATTCSGELMFLIKWKGVNSADLVPAKVANIKCPQIVIKFYENQMTLK